MNALVRLFHRHEWAYALGISPGVTDGRPRPLCFRRACPVCGRREEIEHYGRVVMVDGVKYMADPCWRESEPNAAGRTPADQEKRAAGSSAAACCVCGCEYFVWWIPDQGCYATETPWECYDWQRHPRAVCRDCSRDVPRKPSSVLDVTSPSVTKPTTEEEVWDEVITRPCPRNG